MLSSKYLTNKAQRPDREESSREENTPKKVTRTQANSTLRISELLTYSLITNLETLLRLGPDNSPRFFCYMTLWLGNNVASGRMPLTWDNVTISIHATEMPAKSCCPAPV